MNERDEPAPNSRRDCGARVLVCFAVREEARWFTPPAHPRTDRLVTGIGATRTSAAIQAALSEREPSLVVTSGFAGGLNPRHARGQILFDDTDGGRFRQPAFDPNARPGCFAHSPRVLVTAQEKAQLYAATGADAVEMESSVIVAACRERGVPVVVIRVVSDTAQDDLPLDFNRFSRPDGSLSMTRLVAGALRTPSAIPALLRFQQQLKQAAQNLAAALDAFLRGSGGLF